MYVWKRWDSVSRAHAVNETFDRAVCGCKPNVSQREGYRDANQSDIQCRNCERLTSTSYWVAYDARVDAMSEIEAKRALKVEARLRWHL